MVVDVSRQLNYCLYRRDVAFSLVKHLECIGSIFLVNMVSKQSRDAMLDMLRTGNFSDSKIKCAGYTFKVHKNILAARSDRTFWSTALGSPFQDPDSKKITIHASDPLALATVLTGIYSPDGFTWTDVESTFPGLVQARLKCAPSFSLHSSLAVIESQLHYHPYALRLGLRKAFQDTHLLLLTIMTAAYALADTLNLCTLRMGLLTNIIDRLDDLFQDTMLHPCIRPAVEHIYTVAGENTLLQAHTTALCVARRGHLVLRPGGEVEKIAITADPAGWAVGDLVYRRVKANRASNNGVGGETRLASGRGVVRPGV